MTNRCLVCYQDLDENKSYHPRCARGLFESAIPPEVDLSMDTLKELAKKQIQSKATVTGVQSKLSADIVKQAAQTDRLTVLGILGGRFIIKPPSEKFPSIAINEDLTMHLAEIFEIQTVPHGLIKLQSGEYAYLTRRIDRPKHSKKHLEDFCQLSEKLTEDKYSGSMEQVCKLVRKYSANSGLDVLRIFEIAIFSFLTGNADMHLKNFSMLWESADYIVLAPAYDLLSTRLLISEKNDPEESALTINGKKLKIQLPDFEKFAKSIGLTEAQFTKTLKRFADKLPTALDFMGRSFLTDADVANYRKLVRERAERLQLTVPNRI